ncbi:MAG: DUF2330 domain-containing protein [Verrucomicrobia bacterium]|nr:DUF2330 domain-containing protein [Verrucomicrobiota bacterium]
MCAAILLLCAPFSAAADGMVYPTAVAINVTIPDQRALIHFSNGVERLVIETRFTSVGTNFAWVVPVPSPPVIEPATTGLFPTLQYLFQPRIVYLVDPLYLGVLAGVGVTYLAYLVLFVRPTGRIHRWDVAVCLLMLFAMIAGISEANPRRPRDLDMIWKTWMTCGVVVLGVPIIRLVRNPPILVVCILGVGGILLMLAFSGPATASSKGMSVWIDQPVSILDRKIAGVFDTTTIASRDPQALQTWLRANGFAISTKSEPVIASYLTLPKVQVRLVSRSAGQTQNKLYLLHLWSIDEQPATLDQLRKHVERALANRPGDREWSRYAYGNHFSDWDNDLGGGVHEEDSPGNFVIRQVGGHLEFVAYDALGAAQVLGEWTLPAKAKTANHE